MNRVKRASRPGKVSFAREQRQNPTRADEMLWEVLRGGALGAKFRRQHPVGDFVLDFYCETAQLAVEIDGPTHEAQREYDRWRDVVLGAQGIRVLHFDPDCIENHVARIADTIRAALS